MPELPAETETTVFQLAGRPVTVTRADVEAMRELLVKQVEAQSLEFKDELLASTRGAGVGLMADQVRIGTWYVTPSDDGEALRAMIRLGPGNSPAYGTTIAHTGDGWTVAEVQPIRIHPRR